MKYWSISAKQMEIMCRGTDIQRFKRIPYSNLEAYQYSEKQGIYF